MELIVKSLLAELQEVRMELVQLRNIVTAEKIKSNYLTMSEACNMLHVSRTTISKRINNGEMGFAVKRGKSWLFPADKLRDYASGL